MNPARVSCTICIFCAAVAAIIGCGLPQAKQDQFNVALGVVRSMTAGNFEGAVQKFDAELRDSWPPEKLAMKWREFEIRFGAFDSIGQIGDSDRSGENPDETVVFVSCEFEDGGCTVWISLNLDNQISNIEFEDGDYLPIEETMTDLPEKDRDAALNLIRTMAAGNFENVFDQFDAELKDYLPLEKLRGNWGLLESRYGPFKDIGVLDGRLLHWDNNRSESTVILRCRFERGESTIVVMIDSGHRISMVTFADPDLQD